MQTKKIIFFVLAKEASCKMRYDLIKFLAVFCTYFTQTGLFAFFL